MRAAAVVASACLLTGGCSWIAKRPSGASVVADLSFSVAAYIAVPDLLCGKINDNSCELRGLTTLFFATPFAILGAATGGYALANPGPPPEPPPVLPERPTDEVTERLAQQVRSLVRGGFCVEARSTMDQIAARDAEYHIALLASGALGQCK